MSYVSKVLVDGEKVLYHARVTYALFLPGFALCGFSIIAGYLLHGLDRQWRWLWKMSFMLEQFMPLSRTAEFVSYGIFAIGTIMVMKVYTIYAFTELAVTDRRVIAKVGVTETRTTEIDRHKIAGVTIDQSITGKMLNYGFVTLRGYSGHIGNMPPLSNPYKFQKIINDYTSGNH